MLARITIIRPGYAEAGGDAGGGLPEPDVGGVLGVHRVPPQRLLHGHRLGRARQDAGVRDRGHQFGAAGAGRTPARRPAPASPATRSSTTGRRGTCSTARCGSVSGRARARTPPPPSGRGSAPGRAQRRLPRRVVGPGRLPGPAAAHARRRRHPHGRGDRRRLQHRRPRAGVRPAAARPQTGSGTSANRPIDGNVDAIFGAQRAPLSEMAVNLTKRFSDALCTAGAANAYGIP